MPTPEPLSDAELEQLLTNYRRVVDAGHSEQIAPPHAAAAMRWLATLEQQARRLDDIENTLDQRTRQLDTVAALHTHGHYVCLACHQYDCDTMRIINGRPVRGAEFDDDADNNA